jgi:glycosyltransferase involved in cell wall biosynthesis
MQPTKILYVVSNWPADATGAQQRALNIGRLLKRVGEVCVVVVCPGPDNPQALRALEREFKEWRIMRPTKVVRRNLLARAWNRIQDHFGIHAYTSRNWKMSAANSQAFREMTLGFDVVWLHNIQTVNRFDFENWPHTVLDVDDVPSAFYNLLARSRRNPVKRIVDIQTSRRWRQREGRLLNRFDVLTVCSEQDKRYLGGDGRVFVIPNGFTTPEVRSRIRPVRPRVGFIGMFEYFPNAEGMEWFLREVWPLVKSQVGEAELRLAGPGSDTFLSQTRSDVSGLGWLDNPAEEIASWSTMVVPIRVGGGTRIKIAEGFARRCPVVSTSIGAFGYDVRDGEELLFADSAADFAAACVRLLRDLAFGDALADRAHQRFRREWTWDAFAPRVEAVVEACLSRRGSRSASQRLASASNEEIRV